MPSNDSDGESNAADPAIKRWTGIQIESHADSPTAERISPTFIEGAKAMIFTGPLNLLLFCIPIALISYYAEWPDSITFLFSLLALAPLAERLGFVTEQLAFHTNETIGGLLNATFGNATELIVAISALLRGLYRLVQLSLLGSILSNMLLVLGTAFFCGGLRYETQYFGKISSQVNSTLLMLSTMGLLFPAILSETNEDSPLADIGFSRATSILLLLMYIAFLYFQLYTHKHAYDDIGANSAKDTNSTEPLRSGEGKNSEDVEANSEERVGSPIISPLVRQGSSQGSPRTLRPSDQALMNAEVGGGAAAIALANAHTNSDGEEEEDEEDLLGFHYAIMWLAIMTVFIALLSDALSASIESAAESVHISAVFISAIILPIVGNAAEHAGAVMFAMKGKLDLSLGVAIGSSTQIALFVLPLLVIIGWMDDRDMSLDFGAYETSTLILTVIIVTFAIKDGTSNWLLGLALIVAYILIAAGFWAHKDDNLQ